MPDRSKPAKPGKSEPVREINPPAPPPIVNRPDPLAAPSTPDEKRGRGRPKGAKTKPKAPPPERDPRQMEADAQALEPQLGALLVSFVGVSDDSPPAPEEPLLYKPEAELLAHSGARVLIRRTDGRLAEYMHDGICLVVLLTAMIRGLRRAFKGSADAESDKPVSQAHIPSAASGVPGGA